MNIWGAGIPGKGGIVSAKALRREQAWNVQASGGKPVCLG